MLPATKLKHSNSTQKIIPDGSRIGLSFNQGTIKYNGSLARISGIIPFGLPAGKYKICPLLQDPVKSNQFIVEDLLPKYKGLWPNESNEDVIEDKLREYTSWALHFHPSPNFQDFNDPKLQLWILHTLLLFVIDEMLDAIPEDSPTNLSYPNMNQYLQYTENFYNGVYKTVEEMNEANQVSVTGSISSYRLKFIQTAMALIPNYRQCNHHYVESWKNGLRAWVLLMESNAGLCSPSTRTLLHGHIGIFLPNLEFIALLEGVELSEKIRGDILFDRVRLAFANASQLMNDVIGLSRDIALNQVRDTSILRRIRDEGSLLGLQVAFNDALSQLKWEMNDVQVLANKLKSCYKDDEELCRYLDFLEVGINGQLWWYAASTKYGNMDLKIVQLE